MNRQDKNQREIQTAVDRAWFTWFHLYAPLQPYFDRTWRLPDIEKVPA